MADDGPKTNLVPSENPDEIAAALRLIKAFRKIEDEADRAALIEHAERLARRRADPGKNR